MYNYRYECTDTFGGNANYSWVMRGYVSFKKPVSRETIIRRVKKAIAWDGWCRVHVTDMSYSIELRPTQTSGINQVCFVDMYSTDDSEVHRD